MSFTANTFVRLGLVAIGVSGAGLGTSYVCHTYVQQPPPRNDKVIQLAALTLSSEVVSKSLNDAEVQAQLCTFGLQLLTHPVVVAELKVFFKDELTEDTPTRAALRTFVVRDVIQDAWVKEELLGIVDNLVSSVKENKDLYPSRLLGWLADCALSSMRRDEFWVAVCEACKRAGWVTFVGPPSPNLIFEPPF